MLLILCVVLIAGALAFTLWIRPADLPQAEPALPWQHLEERKARIYENLRDLQFEYRVGKLSDEDYQRTKKGLQAELAATLAGIDSLKASTGSQAAASSPSKRKEAAAASATGKKYSCPHCQAQFDKNMKFCGECGKAMQA